MTTRIDLPLVLASRSPRRRELLVQAGYEFQVMPADESAECGVCSGESPPEMVARLAWRKAEFVARKVPRGLVIGCDTVAECHGQILGKPRDRQHAADMLRTLRGREHRVYSGLCLWRRPEDRATGRVEVSTLVMDPITDLELEAYLDTDLWEGKAGAFGFQDGLEWVHLITGSASNVVGLPMEAFEDMLANELHT